MTWKYYIDKVYKRVYRALFSIKQMTCTLPTDSIKILYYALVHSYLAYGIIVWVNTNQSILKYLVTLQKRVIRVMHNVYYNSHTEHNIKRSQILTINNLLVYQSHIFMFDYLLNKLPSSIYGTFAVNCDSPNMRPSR